MRIRDQRCRGDSLVAWSGLETEVTIDTVLRARGKNDEEQGEQPTGQLGDRDDAKDQEVGTSLSEGNTTTSSFSEAWCGQTISGNKEKLVVNYIIETWSRYGAHKDEDVTTVKVEHREKVWDLPFMEVFDVLGYRISRDGKGVQGTEKTLRKGLGSWWRDGYICRARSVPMKTKCNRVVSHNFQHHLARKR